jgi:FKBP-type peptidyl-prolyl cis-trans isomerase
MKSTCLLLASLMASATSFTPSPQTRTTTSLSAHQLSRSQLLQNAAAAATALTILPLPSSADDDSVTVTPSGITIKVLKSGNGPAPDIGELAAIRFASYAGENKIDNIFDTAEPYYTRVGSGGLIKGVEEVLPKMRLGDRWVLTIPVSFVFGNLISDIS